MLSRFSSFSPFFLGGGEGSKLHYANKNSSLTLGTSGPSELFGRCERVLHFNGCKLTG